MIATFKVKDSLIKSCWEPLQLRCKASTTIQVSELDTEILMYQSAVKYFPQYSYIGTLFSDLGFL